MKDAAERRRPAENQRADGKKQKAKSMMLCFALSLFLPDS
jgi:hypothetical protein